MFERLKSFIGAVKLVKSDAKTQTVQVALTKEFVIDNVPHIEPYGFTAHPQADAECLVVNVGENGERPVAVVIGGRTYRLQGLQAGEVVDKTGNLTAIRSTYDAHTHTGNAGAPTSPPLEPMEG